MIDCLENDKNKFLKYGYIVKNFFNEDDDLKKFFTIYPYIL